jgi:uncharacterized protein with PIN domain
MDSSSIPLFLCDAMLGGLARWLRAAGYDASWSQATGDWQLIHQARNEGRILLTSDTRVFHIGIVRDKEMPALLVPHGLTTVQQLAFVLGAFGLDLLPPRCMACGGALNEVPKENVRQRVPARSYVWLEHFYECIRCGKIFWQGTHWQRIAGALESARKRT